MSRYFSPLCPTRSSKAVLLRDITHAFEKAIWPLQVSTEELGWQPFDPTQPGYNEVSYKDKVREIASLADLAANLLDWFQQLVKYEDSDASIDMEPTSMVDLVQEVVDRTRPFARNEGKQIRVVEPPMAFEVTCAADLVKAALFLLIENAVTYSPQGDTVCVSLYKLPDGSARIEVWDHGSPVPSEERVFLFDAGFRGQTAKAMFMNSRATGSGIGLDHVRRIVVNLHHGKVGYESAEGNNVFYIWLPGPESEEGVMP